MFFYLFFSSGLKSDKSADEMNESHESFGEFVVASGDSPEFFDSAKESLHFLPHLRRTVKNENSHFAWHTALPRRSFL